MIMPLLSCKIDLCKGLMILPQFYGIELHLWSWVLILFKKFAYISVRKGFTTGFQGQLYNVEILIKIEDTNFVVYLFTIDVTFGTWESPKSWMSCSIWFCLFIVPGNVNQSISKQHCKNGKKSGSGSGSWPFLWYSVPRFHVRYHHFVTIVLVWYASWLVLDVTLSAVSFFAHGGSKSQKWQNLLM